MEYQASSAPMSSMPAYMHGNCHFLIHGRRSFKRQEAHLRYRTGRMSRTRYATGSSLLEASLARNAALPCSKSAGHGDPVSMLLRRSANHSNATSLSREKTRGEKESNPAALCLAATQVALSVGPSTG